MTISRVREFYSPDRVPDFDWFTGRAPGFWVEAQGPGSLSVPQGRPCRSEVSAVLCERGIYRNNLYVSTHYTVYRIQLYTVYTTTRYDRPVLLQQATSVHIMYSQCPLYHVWVGAASTSVKTVFTCAYSHVFT